MSDAPPAPDIHRLDVDSFGEMVDYLNETELLNLAGFDTHINNLCGHIYRNRYSCIRHDLHSDILSVFPNHVRSYCMYSQWEFEYTGIFLKLTSVRSLAIQRNIVITYWYLNAMKSMLQNVEDLFCSYNFLHFIGTESKLSLWLPSMKRLHLICGAEDTDLLCLPSTLTCLWISIPNNVTAVDHLYKTLADNRNINTFVFTGPVKNLQLFHSKTQDDILHAKGYDQTPVCLENFVLYIDSEIDADKIETVLNIYRMGKFKNLFIHCQISQSVTLMTNLKSCLTGLSLQGRYIRDHPEQIHPTLESTISRVNNEQRALKNFVNLTQLTLMFFPYTHCLLQATSELKKLRTLCMYVRSDELELCLKTVLQNATIEVIIVKSYGHDSFTVKNWYLNLKALNELRSKVFSFLDKTVDIYVPEQIYVNTKWALKGDTLCKFVRLRRNSSLISNNFVKQFSF